MSYLLLDKQCRSIRGQELTAEDTRNPLNWISRLNPEQRKLIDDGMRELVFDANQMIYDEGSTPKGLYVVKDGVVRLASIDSLGRERILGFFGTGTSFGETSLFARRTHRFSATAKGKLRLGFVPQTRMLKITSERADIAGVILESIAWRHSEALEIRLERERFGLEERLASSLLKLLQMQPANEVSIDGRTEFPLRLTQGDVASVLGASRQSINKIMRQWCDEQVIRLEYGQIIITALDKLEEYAGPDYQNNPPVFAG